MVLRSGDFLLLNAWGGQNGGMVRMGLNGVKDVLTSSFSWYILPLDRLLPPHVLRL